MYKESITSGLGRFNLQIDSTGELQTVHYEEHTIKLRSVGHDILIKHVVAPTDWLPPGMNVDSAKAWLVYIIKYGAPKEQLTISLKLLDNISAVQAQANTGQNLSAIEFENGVRQVHLGTQDEEWFSWYSKKEWMPSRLISVLSNYKLFVTTIDEDGLRSQIPELFIGERFYLHYVLAESPRRKAMEYPKDWDVSTWYAVDQSQDSLEEAWSKQVKT